ncbi:MAG: 1-phosphofructokinase family hexose kinase [Chloroflexota bacterium]
MILIITPNPAVDRTLLLPTTFEVGGISRAKDTIVAAGGKGLNVARAIQILDETVVCGGLVGGFSGQHLVAMAQQEGFGSCWTEIEPHTRTCFIVINPNGADATVFNEPGPVISETDWANLKADVVREAHKADLVCLCGSLPLGTLSEAPADLIKDVRELGVPIWVDSSKLALEKALEGRPTGIKINGDEAADVLQRTVADISSAFDAALEIYRMGIPNVILTLGGDGAVMVNAEGQWWAKHPPVEVVSTVGSGDTFLAGLVTGLVANLTPVEAVKRGVAAGTANALCPGGGAFDLVDFEQLLACVEVAS